MDLYLFFEACQEALQLMSLLILLHCESSSVLVQSTISEELLNTSYAGFIMVVFALQHQTGFPVN